VLLYSELATLCVIIWCDRTP